jgi:hypothetical protein
MNIKLLKYKNRSGLTIIEVMTSIVVAMIGVMGVMILVPFAVRQAQTGLDTEAAAVVARNAFSLFEIGGYRNHDNWVQWDISVNPPGAKEIRRMDSDFPRPYSIDPLGVLEHPSGRNFVDTYFPFNHQNASPNALLPNYIIVPVNLRLPGQNQLTNAPPDYIVPSMLRMDARRMFRAADDLVFGDARDTVGQTDSQLNGPSQIFDVANGVNVRRQTAGRFSWSAIAVPNGRIDFSQTPPAVNVSNWRLSVLVFKDRNADVTAEDTVPVNFSISSKMRVARVLAPTTFATPVSTVHIQAGIPAGSIKKDEWVMLINRKQVNPGNPVPNGFDWQIKFYRIINFEQLTPTGDPNPESVLTLDGPDFDFDTNENQLTACVHLKNVVGVYERTIVPEGNSTWNLSY